MESELIKSARLFADERHAGQFRINKGKLPTIMHLEQVASWTEKVGGTDEMIAAAWLHDVIEDTPTTLGEIEEKFGAIVAIYVGDLTDAKDIERYPTLTRKAMQAERLKNKSPEIKIIKLCDQLSNCTLVYEDQPPEWSNEQCWHYISGAKKVADVCSGHSEFLDREFNKIWGLAKDKYGKTSTIN